MSIDFNAASKQSKGNGTIPRKSRVHVQLEIVYPEADRQGSQPGLTRGKMDYLNTIMHVTRGSYAGRTIYHNFNLAGATTKGQQTAINISMSQIRAMIEAARGIRPDDASPQATQGRIINAWTDLNGITFFCEVGYKESRPSQDGKIYTNNTMERVITVDDPDYAQLVQAGEIITDEPVPAPREAAEVQQTQASWGAQPQPQASQPAAQWGTQQPSSASPAPSWAQTPPPPPPAQAGVTDDVPF